MKAFWLKSSLITVLLLLVAVVGALPTRSDSGQQKPKLVVEQPSQKRGAATATPLAYRSPGARHKLVIPNADRELQQALQDARVIAKARRFNTYSVVEVSSETVRAAGRGVVMKDEEAESKRTIENAFAAAGLTVPPLKEVLAGLPVDKARAQKIVTLLLRDRVLLKLTEDLVFHRDALAELRRKLADYKTKSPKIDVPRFKELTGITRKYAIPLLEYLDRERVTRRVGDERIIL